ncbi:hypothetical protein V6Z11_D03G000100 [Gossypium hirsutum]
MKKRSQTLHKKPTRQNPIHPSRTETKTTRRDCHHTNTKKETLIEAKKTNPIFHSRKNGKLWIEERIAVEELFNYSLLLSHLILFLVTLPHTPTTVSDFFLPNSVID